MIAEENVLYLRFILLLIHGGTALLRKITEKALKNKKTALYPFLASVKNTLMGTKDLNKKQKELLYPSSSADLDIKDFDITLLSFIILHCCNDVLDGNERNAATQIRDIRNKYHAHVNAAVMTTATYTKVWTKVLNIIYTVAHGMSDKDKNELLDIINNVADDQFDVKTALEELKKIDISNCFYGSIKEKLDEMERCQKEMATDLEDIKTEQIKQREIMATVEERTSEMREELETIKRQLKNQGKINTVKNITYGKVHANADDQETTKEAESCLLRASNESLKRAETKEYSQSELQAKTDGFIEDVEKLGVKVTGVKEGSVVFEFTCSSLDALIDLLDYFCSSCFRARLDDIAMALENVVGKKVDLFGFIDLESLQNVIQKLHHFGHERIVQFEMECAGVDGLLHVLEVFEEDKAANSLNELSKALSETVKKPVTLHTSIDIDQMQRAIDSLKEHIALENANKIDRRNESCSADNGLEDGIHSAIKSTDKEFPDESLAAELSEPCKIGKSLAEAQMAFPGARQARATMTFPDTKQPLCADRPKEILFEYQDNQNLFTIYDGESKIEKDVDRLERENTQLKEQKEQLDEQIKDLIKEKENTDRKRKTEEETSAVKRRLLKQQNYDLEQKIKCLSEEVGRLEKQIHDAEERVDILAGENNHLREQNGRLEQQTNVLKEEKHGAEKRVEILARENNHLREQNGRLEQHIRDLEEKKLNADKKIKSLSENVRFLEEAVWGGQSYDMQS